MFLLYSLYDPSPKMILDDDDDEFTSSLPTFRLPLILPDESRKT